VTRSHTLRREFAATRVTDDVRVVCATGWTTPVHQLSGATRILWEALDGSLRPDELAATVGVDPDDPFFAQALELLVAADLFTSTPEPPQGPDGNTTATTRRDDGAGTRPAT
jgi:hypothetical protein